MLVCITSNAILAQNKILTQQIEALTKQMSKMPQQLQVVHFYQSQTQSMKCDFCGGDHLNGHCSFKNNPSEEEVHYVSNQERQGGFSNNNNYQNNMPQEWKTNKNQSFGWKQDVGSSNRQASFQ